MGYLITCAIVLLGAFCFSYACNDLSCSSLRQEAGVQTKYTVLNGCFVKINGKWIPENRWRTIEED
jgi:hypothetical protein